MLLLLKLPVFHRHFLGSGSNGSRKSRSRVEQRGKQRSGWWLTLDGSESHALDIEVLQDVEHLNQVNTASRAWSAANDLVPAVRT